MPLLERVAAFLRRHPARNGRSDAKRLADVLRCAAIATTKRGVGVPTEVWIACCLEHAEYKAEHQADPMAALWWALTRAASVDDLDERVAPELHAIVARAAAATPSTTPAPRPSSAPFDDVQKHREQLRKELEEKRKNRG